MSVGSNASAVWPWRRGWIRQNPYTDYECGYYKRTVHLHNEARNLLREAVEEREATGQLQRMCLEQQVEIDKQALEVLEKVKQVKDAALEVSAANRGLYFGSILLVFVAGVWCGATFSSRKTV